MGLPLTTESLDSIDESLRSHYVEENGKFRLDLDGYEDPTNLKSALQKERDAAKNAQKALSEMTSKYAGIDADQTRQLLAKLAQDEDARLIAEGKIDEVIEKRVNNMRSSFEDQQRELNSKLESEQNRVKAYKSKAISAEIVKASTQVGVLNTALNDVILRSTGQFDIDANGNVVAIDSSGNVIYDADGQSPLSVTTWVNKLKKDAPHLFVKGTHSTVESGGGGSNLGAPNLKMGDTAAERQAYFKQKYNLPK